MTSLTTSEHLNPLQLQPLYSLLKQRAIANYERDGVDALVIKNRVSALRAYMKWCRRTDEDTVGREFHTDFERNLGLWSDDMRRDGKKPRTISDRCDMLVKWRGIVELAAGLDTLPETFPEALAEAMARRGFSQNGLSAAVVGISSHAIGDWVSGRRRPARNVIEQITKIEVALQIPDGILKTRLGFVIERFQVNRSAKENRRITTAYGSRLSKQYSPRAKLHYLKAPHENVRKEWSELVAFKVSDDREHSSKRDTWRVKVAAKTGKKYNWSCIYNNKFVPAADAAWGFLSRYMAWLCLGSEHGGAGISAERICTLGWILNDAQVRKFMAWMQMRSDGVVHSGMVQIMNYARMLLRPETGWLWLNPDIAYAFSARDTPIAFDREVATRPKVQELWRAECERVWAAYGKIAEAYKNSKSYGLARDPKAVISDIIAEERPLAVLMKMLGVLKRNPPPINRVVRRAVWLRDVLLFSWLIANPLRVQHFAVMTYRNDQTGNLYHRQGVWHYRCESSDFKNDPGDYDVTLPSFVGDAIAAYLQEGRAHLAGASEGDFVFLPSNHDCATSTDRTGVELPDRPGMWSTEGIAIRFRCITGALREGKPAFGPHAMRHLIATDYLRRSPGAYKMVAHLLNDSLQTVLAVYGTNDPQDGLSIHYMASELELSRVMA